MPKTQKLLPKNYQYINNSSVGKTELLDQRNKGITKRLVQFHLEAFDSEVEMWPGGGEAIHRNGEYVG